MKYVYLCLLVFLMGNNVLFCQITAKEQDYTITYLDNAIELRFDQPVQLQATTVATQMKVVLIAKSTTTYLIENSAPSTLIKLEYSNLEARTDTVYSSILATPSASTGAINVYFNHPVATNFSQVQAAVNMGTTLDDFLINKINACSSTLDIAIYNSYSPNSTTNIAGAINAAYFRGVQVRVIYDYSASNVMISYLNTNIPKLASANGVNYAIMHNKFVIFDANHSDANKPLVWTGSTNWTTGQIEGPDTNNVIVIQDQALALGYKLEFEEMWVQPP